MDLPLPRCAAVFVPLLMTLGCATTLGAMPAPPLDEQLANNGTPAAQQQLLKRYELKPAAGPLIYWTGFDPVDVGEARRPTTGGVLDLDVQPDLGLHMTKAGMDLQPAYQRWRTVGYVSALGVLGLGALWLGAITIFNLVTLAGLPGFDAASGAVLAGTVTSTTFVLLLLAVAAGSALVLISQFMVKRAVHHQLDTYNVKLRQRIVEAAHAAPPPAPEPPMPAVRMPPPPTPEGATPLPEG